MRKRALEFVPGTISGQGEFFARRDAPDFSKSPFLMNLSAQPPSLGKKRSRPPIPANRRRIIQPLSIGVTYVVKAPERSSELTFPTAQRLTPFPYQVNRLASAATPQPAPVTLGSLGTLQMLSCPRRRNTSGGSNRRWASIPRSQDQSASRGQGARGRRRMPPVSSD